MISPEDRVLLDAFAARVRLVAPSAGVWAFGSRARGSAHPDSDLDLCVVVPKLTRALREAIHGSAWEIGFEHGRLLAPVILTADDFERPDVGEHPRGQHSARRGRCVTDAEKIHALLAACVSISPHAARNDYRGRTSRCSAKAFAERT
jgi:predicted nucleotidyltransferase